MIANSVATLLGGSEEPVDIPLTKIVPSTNVGIGRAVIPTLDTSPIGHGSVASHKSLPAKA
ncbi:hypothetical protein GCM10022290_02480 [Sagittula marina]